MTIVLHFYPNGEFSQGVDTSSNRPPKHVCKQAQILPQTLNYTDADIQRVKEQNESIPAQVYAQKGVLFSTSGGAIYSYVEGDNTKSTFCKVRSSEGGEIVRFDTSVYRLVHLGLLSPLVHQSVESCEKPASRKKLTSMSKRMSRNIRNGVYLLEKRPGGKDVLSFLTLTLPSLSTEGLKSCCENWDSMVKRFFDWLRIKLKSKGLDLNHVYCTEIQLKRLQQRGEYAPHLHVVYQGRATRKSAWAITPRQARKAWARCIHAFTDELFDTKALENLQRIKYSAARYLSKYLSKGSNIIPDTSEDTPICHLRTQWGGMARAISKGIRQATQRFTGHGATKSIAWGIFNNIDGLVESGFVLYFKRGFIPLDSGGTEGLERGLHVGCGCLSTPTFEGGLIPILSYIFAAS